MAATTASLIPGDARVNRAAQFPQHNDISFGRHTGTVTHVSNDDDAGL